ncbi:DUF7680 family protein [Paracraurococcus lichenis]|uniref:DUF7680 domain-containing protein n=1 Tax=Paracraurococcus lichenis TaxID=3064888 RepID=A0ABT9EBA7_9PROT|nr:hypothetical protein [Paracraurococcus sp. LOR1-02]MDO9713492.1 hypothetical protein [Paracraurococcus sp. LOR1-02]
MSARIARLTDVTTPASAPVFEVRMVRHGAADTEVEVWQLPSPASPQVVAPVRLAGLRGRNLDLIEHRVLKLLRQAGVRFAPLSDRKEAHALGEDDALRLGLLFRTLAPMRSRDNVRAVAEGIEAMGREEASYWLGMAMHRKNPRRVLTALRSLLTDPHRSA